MSDNAAKDQNHVSSLLGISNADGTSPVSVYADPATHRLLVDGVGVTGPTGPTGAQGTNTYTPASGLLWADPDPTTVTGALDRLAVAVFNGTTGAIA